MTRALRNRPGRPAPLFQEPAPARIDTAAELHAERVDALHATANVRAQLFRMDPTPERLEAWADAFAMLPEDGAA